MSFDFSRVGVVCSFSLIAERFPGVLGGSGGSGSISASTESSFKDTTKVTKFSVDFGGGELNKISPSLQASVFSSDQSIGLKLSERTYCENNLPRSNSSVSTDKKDYHRKHMVYDIHLKALKVIVVGLKHRLDEFRRWARYCYSRIFCGDNEKLKRRFIVFAGSVIVYNERRLQELGNRLKMNNIAFDKGNSHVVYVPFSSSIYKAILSLPFFPHIGQAVRRLAARGTIFTRNGDQGSTKRNGCYML
nr:hypothetical protein [Tanacetum cinerariifolium]